MAGFTTVSATVLDPTNLPYANGTWTANFVDPGTPGKTPLINGSIITRVYAGDLDSFGAFTVSLPDNAVIGTQTGAINTQWTFTFVNKSAPVGLGAPPAFSTGPITITGATQNITSIVQAAAASLNIGIPALAANQTWTGVNTFTGITQINGIQTVAALTDAAIKSAIAACPSGGTVYMPAGTYICKNNLPITITKALNLVGAGWGTILQVDSSVGSSTPIIDVVPSGGIGGIRFQDFTIQGAAQSSPGSYAIQVDTSPSNNIGYVIIEHLQLGQIGVGNVAGANGGMGSGAIWLNNTAGEVNGGIFFSWIEHCFIANGIKGTLIGDGVMIQRNLIQGTGNSIDVTFTSGSANFHVIDNTINPKTGAALHTGSGPSFMAIVNNEIETPNSTGTGSNGAFVDIDSTVASPAFYTNIDHNSFQMVNGTTLNTLRINNSNFANITNNWFQRGGGSAKSIVVTANAVKTRIRTNNFNGDVVANVLSDSAPVGNTLLEWGGQADTSFPLVYRDNTGTTTVSGAGANPLIQGNTGANYIYDGFGGIAIATSTSFPAAAVDGFVKINNLVNATLTSASNANNVTLLNYQTGKAAITGTGSDVALYTYSLPANTVATLKAIRVTCAWNHSTGTASVTYKIKVNGVLQDSFASTTTTSGTLKATIGAPTSTTSDIEDYWAMASIAGTVGGASGIGGLSWTSNQTVEVDFNVAATDQVTPKLFLVELVQ